MSEREIVKRLRESRMYEGSEEEQRNNQYKDYIARHRAGVMRVWKSIMRPLLVEEGIDNATLDLIHDHINCHDESKYRDDEFYAYRDRFYGLKEDYTPEIAKAFDYAWNLHQKRNPHHWQYWCLINDVDEPQVSPQDMPFDYIMEMLCDWQSAGKYYGNSAYEWYQKQKHKMKLSDYTRSIVEKYIVYLK